MKTFIVDIDGTICTDSRGRYELARPMGSRIQYFNELFKQGNEIIY